MQKSKSFILPMFMLPGSIYDPCIETYMGNVQYEGEESWGNYFYIACPADQGNKYGGAIRVHSQYVTEFVTEDKVFFVMDFTERQKKQIVKPFLDGAYSKIDRDYVAKHFPKYRQTGAISSNWRILMKDEWDIPEDVLSLRDFWYEKIGKELPEGAEV